MKQAAIGQCIVHAARPQGSLMPLLFGVGVDSDQCDQQLQMKLAQLGFSLSVDEIRRYKYSVLNTDQETGHNISKVVPVMHFVADNVDHNITTLDGLGTFHGMGIISATVLPPGGFGNMKRLVKRLKQPLRASEATHNNVHLHCAPVKSMAFIAFLLAVIAMVRIVLTYGRMLLTRRTVIMKVSQIFQM
jgi:hypothetical protein